MDHEQYRDQARERWDASAPGWERRRKQFQAATAPVSAWLVEHIDPGPGQVILELAAGPGDTGLMAAERVAPGGRLISTDGSPEMVAAAERRARELGVENAEFKAMEAEWIDLPTAAVDGVLCRWGYMLLADPETALRETRRVLRPGGRVALAAWSAPADNSFLSLPGGLLVERGLAEAPAPGAPGPFAFAEPGRIESLLHAVGFADAEVDTLELTFSYPSRDVVFETWTDLSAFAAGVLSALSPADHARLRDALDERLAPYVQDDGTVRLGGRALLAVASA